MSQTIIDEIIITENEYRKEKTGNELSFSEKTGTRRYLSSLLSRAKKGSWASRKLNLRFGLDEDVSMGDYGALEQRHDTQ